MCSTHRVIVSPCALFYSVCIIRSHKKHSSSCFFNPTFYKSTKTHTHIFVAIYSLFIFVVFFLLAAVVLSSIEMSLNNLA